MKIGLILSAVLVVALAIVFLFTSQSVPDAPTNATRPEKLAKIELDAGLPKVYESTEADVSANDAYQKVLQLYMDHQKAYDGNDVPNDLADQMTTLMIDAQKAGKITRPFLDDQIPLAVMGEPEFRGGLEAIDFVVLKHAKASADHGDQAYAFKAAMSVWALGQRLFENCVRLHNRRMGIIMMKDSGDDLYKWKDSAVGYANLDKAMGAWANSINRLDSAYEEKIKMILTPKPPSVADVVNVAKNDKDLTFRTEAMLYLGLAKFNAHSKGNERVILATIEEGQNDPEPLISGAAKAAAALTLEEMRKLK